MSSASSIGRFLLLPHPVSERGAVQGLVEECAVEVSRPATDQLRLGYRLTGDIAALRLPDPRPAARTDGLWRHTCFEAFVGRTGDSEYWEYNLSPSGAWAAYHFTAYREGMEPYLKGAPPAILARTGVDHLDLDVVLDLAWLSRTSVGLRLGISAVIEDRAQILSYWAIKHPAGKPDFHHADGFVVALD
jgi:hypothetical protein